MELRAAQHSALISSNEWIIISVSGRNQPCPACAQWDVGDVPALKPLWVEGNVPAQPHCF